MKLYNYKWIKIYSSIKVSLLYLCIEYHSLSLTDDVYSLFHLQHCLPSYVSVTVSTIQYSNGYHRKQYYYTMALIFIIFIIIRMYLLTNVITMLMNKHFHLSASMFRVHDCACVIKFYLGKWRPI